MCLCVCVRARAYFSFRLKKDLMFGNPRGVRVLHDLILCEDPELLVLIETKLPSRKLDRIWNRIGMYGCLGVDCEGRVGGLALLWKDSLDIQFINFS